MFIFNIKVESIRKSDFAFENGMTIMQLERKKEKKRNNVYSLTYDLVVNVVNSHKAIHRKKKKQEQEYYKVPHYLRHIHTNYNT